MIAIEVAMRTSNQLGCGLMEICMLKLDSVLMFLVDSRFQSHYAKTLHPICTTTVKWDLRHFPGA